MLGVCFTSCNKDEYTTAPATSNASSNLASGGTYTTNNNNATGAITPGDATTTPTTTSYGWKWNSADAYIANIFVKTVKDGDQAQAQTIELNSRYSIMPTPAMLPAPALTTGTYNRIEAVVNIRNNGMGGLVVNGIIGPGASSIPVVIKLTEPLQVVYGAMNKVIGANERYQMVVRIDVNALNNTLSEADATNARVAGGPIEISAKSNVELYNKVMQNIKSIVVVDLVRS